MKIPFKTVPSRYIEKVIPDVTPAQLVMWHACQKVRGASIPSGARWVLGADTVVVFRDRILGKPRNRKEAERMLKLLSGRAHYVYTGVSIIDHEKHSIVSGFSRTKVYFRKLSGKTIREYLEEVNPLDKAGAYGIQEGPGIVRKIEGSRTNVIGLPVELVRTLLRDIRKNGF